MAISPLFWMMLTCFTDVGIISEEVEEKGETSLKVLFAICNLHRKLALFLFYKVCLLINQDNF